MTEESPKRPKSGVTSNDELRELVDEWREFAEPSGWDGYSKGVREGIESCADELEAVLEDE